MARRPAPVKADPLGISASVPPSPLSASLPASLVLPLNDPGVTALYRLIVQSLDDDKAQEMVAISLEGKSPMADAMVIASGTSARQIAAMAEHLVIKLKADMGVSARVTGAAQGDWVLIDAGDVIVHLFRPEVRTFYNLEKMWSVEVGDTRSAAAG